MRVAPDAKIFGTDPAVSRDGARFGEDQRGTADRAAAEMREVPLAGEAVDAGVLAHRRYEHAVCERQPAKDERLEQVGHRYPIVSLDRR
jgi:hypothetical protein